MRSSRKPWHATCELPINFDTWLRRLGIDGIENLPDSLCSQVALLYAALHANASQCYLNLNQFKLAQEEASRCLKHMPTHEKALLRRASASEQLGERKSAIADLEIAIAGNPNLDPAHRRTLDRLRTRCAKEEQKSQASLIAGGLHRDRPHPAGWAINLPKKKQYEWFVDCYRMRVDDDYCWGGGNLHGLYNIDGSSAGSVVVDFLLFCRLAVARGAIPSLWSWSGCLEVAAKLLPYAFEKSDAHKKWGNEDFFSTGMGGRSLRCTAELIYGGSCQEDVFSDEPEDDVRYAIEVEIERRLSYSPGPERFIGKVVANVGGDKVWRCLCEALVPHLGLGDDDYDDYDDFDEEEEEEEEDEEDEEEEKQEEQGDSGVGSDLAESFGLGGTQRRGDSSSAVPSARAGWSRDEETSQHSCGGCGRKTDGPPGVKFKKCSRCLVVRYCSDQCQKEHWKIHKKTCRAPQLAA